MVSLGSVAKRAGVVTGVVAGVAGAVYAGERAVAARIRRGGDDDQIDDTVDVEFDHFVRVDTHDGGSIYAIERTPTGRGSDASDSSLDEAPTIVLAHGITLSSRVWARQFRTLPEAGFRTIAFDGRGHGESTVGDSGHSIDNLADDLRAVLTAFDVRNAVLVGHSMGGMAVQSLAARHPEEIAARVRGIVLLSTSARAMTSDAHRTRRSLERVVGVVPDVGAVMRQRNLGLLIARVGFGDDADPRGVEATRQMLGACSRDTLRDAGRALLTLDFSAQLPEINVPTLVVVGSADVVTSPRESRQIADLIPHAELVEFPRAGHMLMYERTEELDRLIVDFARRCLETVPAPDRASDGTGGHDDH
ncbi:MAG: alpha/beta fold hydrolase [Acidimicrobiia bacterium]